MGTFGSTEIMVPRARLEAGDGKTSEWKSKALRAYQRHTKAADALIASTYLASTNTRRVRRALAALFGGAVGKDTVSRVWRKVKTDWEAWNSRSLANEPIIRLILDGTVVRVRLDRKATSISLLVVIGVREDGQKVLLAVKDMGGETTEAWRTVLDHLIGAPVDQSTHRRGCLRCAWEAGGRLRHRCHVHGLSPFSNSLIVRGGGSMLPTLANSLALAAASEITQRRDRVSWPRIKSGGSATAGRPLMVTVPTSNDFVTVPTSNDFAIRSCARCACVPGSFRVAITAEQSKVESD